MGYGVGGREAANPFLILKMDKFSKEYAARRGDNKPVKVAKPSRKKVKQVTSKQDGINREYSAVIAKMDQDLPPLCQSCRKPEYEHSHLISRRIKEFATDRRNIYKQCRGCHKNWESGYIWLLGNGRQLMAALLEMSTEHYYTKLYQAQERVVENDVDFETLPAWFTSLE